MVRSQRTGRHQTGFGFGGWRVGGLDSWGPVSGDTSLENPYFAIGNYIDSFVVPFPLSCVFCCFFSVVISFLRVFFEDIFFE